VSRVLVTGAGGFIGRHTLAPLLAAGHEVHAVTSRPLVDGVPADAEGPDDALRETASAVRWRHADLLAPDSATALMEEVGPSHLLHLAWYTRPRAYWTALQNLDWVEASLRLLRAFGEIRGSRVVVAGTCAEYAWTRNTHCVERAPARVGAGVEGGASMTATPAATSASTTATPAAPSGAVGPARADEPTRTCPATLYGAAKHGLHVVAQRWAPQAGVTLAWGRIFYAYGPYEHPARLVSAVALALLRGEEVPCTHGMQVCDYLYTPELGSALAALLDSEVAGPVNVASGEPVRVADVVAAIGASTGRPELVRMGALPQRPGEPERLTADVRRLREEVGWRPSIDLGESIARTVEWLKAVA
jgi:dTDP-L-rhamnose 4-epimerase